MEFKVLQDFIYEDGRRISAGQVVDLPIERVAHLISSGKIQKPDVIIDTFEISENTTKKKKWGLGNAGK